MAAVPTVPLLICVTGVECTGKTALAEQLARWLDAPLVSEAARDYLRGRTNYDRDDVLAIARAQLAAEHSALERAESVAVADTDLTVIQVWWQEKYGELDPWLIEALARRTPRRYLLPQPDLPWEFDPLRESPHDRERLHERYRALLEADLFPFAEVFGLGEARFEGAREAVAPWLAQACAAR